MGAAGNLFVLRLQIQKESSGELLNLFRRKWGICRGWVITSSTLATAQLHAYIILQQYSEISVMGSVVFNLEGQILKYVGKLLQKQLVTIARFIYMFFFHVELVQCSPLFISF